MKTSLREFAAKVRETADIVDIIGSIIPLKRTGSTFKALCPFHREKTPSFNVHPARQIFHCFGCGIGGDVIKFWMLHERLDFRSALETLARRLGLPVPELSATPEDLSREKKRRLLFEVNQFALKYYQKCLEKKAGGEAREYLSRRGVEQGLWENFQLGWATENWDDFLTAAGKNGYSSELLNEAGLILPGKTKGGFYDRFRGRIIFPILDLQGHCVAFGGRILTSGEPKYLNSPETETYKKGKVLYGLHLAREALRGEQPALLVEGYMDLIALYKFGFTTGVASLGTALTEDQARLLKRFTKEVIFIYDGDEAGQQAMLRGCEVLLGQSLLVGVVVLPEKDDPDTFLARHGTKTLQSLIEKRIDFLDFFFETGRKKFNINTPEGKIAVLDMLKPILEQVHQPIMFNDFTMRLSSGLKLDQKLIIQHIRAKSENMKKSVGEVIYKQAKEGIPLLELGLLKILIENPDLRETVQQELDPDWLTNPIVRAFIQRLLQSASGGQEISNYTGLEEHVSEEEAQLLREIAFLDTLMPEEPGVKMLPIILKRLHIAHEAKSRHNMVMEVQKIEKEMSADKDTSGLTDGIHQKTLHIWQTRKNLF
jgi:DNA primase